FLTGSSPERRLSFGIAYGAALAGVFLGSLCLAGRDRRLASAALLILGVGYYYAWCGRFKTDPELASVGSHPLSLPLVLGGLSAFLLTLFTYRKQRVACADDH